MPARYPSAASWPVRKSCHASRSRMALVDGGPSRRSPRSSSTPARRSSTRPRDTADHQPDQLAVLASAAPGGRDHMTLARPGEKSKVRLPTWISDAKSMHALCPELQAGTLGQTAAEVQRLDAPTMRRVEHHSRSHRQSGRTAIRTAEGFKPSTRSPLTSFRALAWTRHRSADCYFFGSRKTSFGTRQPARPAVEVKVC